MKALALVPFCLALGCGPDTSEVALAVVQTSLQDALTDVTVTEDCDDGGTVTITALLDKVDEPFKLELDVSFAYAGCVDDRYGTVDGTVTYTKLTTGTATGTYATELVYQGNVIHETTICSANISFSEDVVKPTDMKVAKLCRHPEMKILEKLEKDCKVKVPRGKGHGSRKKDKCDLNVL